MRRFGQLLFGLVFFGIGIGLMAQSTLGVPSWDVLHQGLSEQFGLGFGTWSIIVSFFVLLLWLPLREPYGIGTVLNAIVIGWVINITVEVVPEADDLRAQIVLLAVGIFLIGWATGPYIGAQLGPGPRDGLMTGIARRGPSIRLTRTVLEITVLVLGILMGGTFGIGTVAYVLAVGPIVQFFLPRWTIDIGRDADGRVRPG